LNPAVTFSFAGFHFRAKNLSAAIRINFALAAHWFLNLVSCFEPKLTDASGETPG
jgi:hypothetical protein